MACELVKFANCKILRNHKIITEDIWVRNGKIVNPEKIFFDEKIQADTVINCNGNYIVPGFIELQINEDIWVRNGKIVNPEKIFFDEKIQADTVINCNGNYIVPGFIELQINGGYGYDFSYVDNTEEGLALVSQKLLSQGVTSFCPTIVTSPKDVYRKIVPKIKRRNGGRHGATILGIHAEGPFINKEKKGAHPPEYIVEYGKDLTSVIDMYGSLDNIQLITLAPELKNSEHVIKELTKRNIIVSVGHSIANLATGEEAVKNGATFITHLFNAMLPFHHRDPGLVGLLASDNIPRDKSVFFGIIADGIHTHPAALRIAYRVHPDGLVLVTDAISALGLHEGQHRIGQMNVEIKDGQAYIAGTNTLCGSVATMIECVHNLMKFTDCGPEYALEAASLHPAKVLGLEKSKGTLNFGSDADFVMLNEDFEIKSTWIYGNCVYQDNLML